MQTKITRTAKKSKELKRNKKEEELANFLQSDFILPHSRKDPKKFGNEDDVKKEKLNSLTSKTKEVVNENRSLKRDIQSKHRRR